MMMSSDVAPALAEETSQHLAQLEGEERKSAISRQAWREVLGTPHGRLVIREIMAECGFMRSPFDKHNSEMSRKTGKMEVGHFVHHKVGKASPELYLKMLANPNEFD